jgi:small subunit ribosomal protein S18
MARPDRKKPPKDANRKAKKKACFFCTERAVWVDYKDLGILRRFLSERGKIRARRVTGNCAQHQRDVAVAIKTARELAMLPYTQRTATERAPRPDRRAEGGRPGPRAAVEPEVEELEEAEEVGVGIGGED